MRAGRLRHRLVIKSLTETRDADGAISTVWTTTVATIWGRVEPLTGREFSEVAASGAETTHKIRIRHFAGLTRKHRLLFGSRVFAIESVMDVDERDREMIVMCKEEV